ncbi:hypothetical protein K439DRAFT_1413701 [Ramaria rubella]|nr:hypothetical protein K439DRAFT_1413701 [Ramaria rubella]
MRFSSVASAALLLVALPLSATADHRGPSRRHNALASRKRTDLELQQYHRRDNNARGTFYDVGLGACGITNVPSDFIVALNSCEFGSGYPGPNCFKMITIEYNGKQTQAQITDECPGCPCGGLDMSTGLFTFFAPESVGVITMNWWYNDGGSAPASTTSQKPSPTSTWVPPPTSTSQWVDPSPWTSQTSSTKAKPSSMWSSSSSWSSSSVWSSTSASANSTTTSWKSTPSSSSIAPSATPVPVVGGTPSAPENLQGINVLISELGKLVIQYGS